MEVKNIQLSEEDFFREREEVLAEHPMGKDVNLDEAIEYQKTLFPTKNYVLKVEQAKQRKDILLHGAEGADTVDRHIKLLRFMKDEGQADLASTWIDALTRNHRYEEAELAVKKAESTGNVMLNGLPIVYYGVAGTRKLIDSVELPVCVYANGPDLRLIAEIAIAGGHTATTLGGALCAFWGYTSDMPLEEVIRNYQYHYRLQGYYEEKGVPIWVKTIGTVSGMIAPSLTMAASIIEGLIAAGQGVKHIELYNCGTGNLAQDVASVIVLRKLGQEYVKKSGHKDVHIYIGNQHPNGIKFPTDESQAYVILGWSSIVAVLGRTDVTHFFTIDEGSQIPRMEKNAATHRHVRMVLNMWKDQNIDFVNNKETILEAEMVEKETRSILDKVLDMGEGDLIVGAVRAMEVGVLDQAFATTGRTLSKVLGVRDAQGAVRYLDPGNLPFTKDILEFHKEKIAERSRKEGRKVGYDALIGDIYAPSRGLLISTPTWHTEGIL